MKPLRCWPVVLPGLVLLAVLALAAVANPQEGSMVYSVQVVQMGLARDPDAWLGRTVRVRGVAGIAGCVVETAAALALCSIPQFRLAATAPAAGAEALPLAMGSPAPLLATWRQLPLLGVLAPRPQVVHWGVAATYRIRIRASTGDVCGSIICYEAVLPDVEP